jgi:hypothetical protein
MEKLVESLLFEFDCVILPGFGGFVAQKTNASIHPSGMFAYPASKTIAFNKNLNQNDGLLASKLTKQNSLSFDDAQVEVEKFVQHIFLELDKSRKFTFGKIGSFILDGQKNVEFIPFTKINFLLDSFGLPAVQIQPLLEKSIARPEKEVPRPIVQKTTGRIKKWIPALVSLPVAVAILAWPFMNHSSKQGVDNFSGFGFFSSTEAKYSERIALELPSVPERSFVVEAISETVATQNNKPISTQSNSIQPETPQSNSNWMLIVGCFQLEENAQNLVLDLKSKGFEASIAGTAPNGLIRVAAGSAVNREQLEEAYIKAKQSGLDVWWFNAN